MDVPSSAPPSRRRADLIPPAELARIGGLELVARALVEGFLQGLHSSPHRGFSAEFAEHRSYQPGDDLRHLDWRMFGRSGRLFVKQFEEETNLRAYLLLDLSASMNWTSQPGILPTKDWYARQLAAALGLILLRQGDAVGITTFRDTIMGRLPPRGGRAQWPEVIRHLEGTPAGGGTAAAPALRDVALRLRRRGLVVLISDLLLDPAATLNALHFLRHRGHQVIVFHIFDPGETDLTGGGETLLVDPESRDELLLRVQDHRDAYRQSVSEVVREWERDLRSGGMEYQPLISSEPFTRALRAHLRKRSRIP